MPNWDSPYMNIWTEVVLRKVQGGEFHNYRDRAREKRRSITVFIRLADDGMTDN